VKTLTNAIGQAEELGLLGKNILGSGVDLEWKFSRVPALSFAERKPR
jgi:NADH:ubiquinone oxidoreductase subunit F (NADH-binding)